MISVCLCACGEQNPAQKAEAGDPILATVNGEPILKSEIDPVYEEYKESDITYEQMIEDTIDEILVIQQAPKYKLSVSEADVDESVEFYKITYPEMYQELSETYTEKAERSAALFHCA